MYISYTPKYFSVEKWDWRMSGREMWKQNHPPYFVTKNISTLKWWFRDGICHAFWPIWVSGNGERERERCPYELWHACLPCVSLVWLLKVCRGHRHDATAHVPFYLHYTGCCKLVTVLLKCVLTTSYGICEIVCMVSFCLSQLLLGLAWIGDMLVQ